MPPGWMARNAAIPLEVERRRHMENEERIAILCWKRATERGDFFCGREMITFIFPSNEISPEWEREREGPHKWSRKEGNILCGGM